MNNNSCELFVIFNCSFVRLLSFENATFSMKMLIRLSSVNCWRVDWSNGLKSSQVPRLVNPGIFMTNVTREETVTPVLLTSKYLSLIRSLKLLRPTSVTSIDPWTSSLAKGRHQKKNCRFGENCIIYLTPLPPYLKSEKQKNEILVCLRPPLPPG